MFIGLLLLYDPLIHRYHCCEERSCDLRVKYCKVSERRGGAEQKRLERSTCVREVHVVVKTHEHPLTLLHSLNFLQ